MWTQRVQVTFTGRGDYTNFPFDSQIFDLHIESLKYTTEDVLYGWHPGLISINVSLQSLLLDLRYVDDTQYSRIIRLQSGTYQRSGIKLQVDRLSSFYFSILFVPLFLTTIFSFSTFWMVGNLKLIFILLINIFTILFKIWFRVSMLPPVSGSVCAVDYIDICLSITLFVLIETFAMTVIENYNIYRNYGVQEYQLQSSKERCLNNNRIICDVFRIPILKY